MRLGKTHCDDLYRGIMIHPPSPRHRKDGGPHEGGGEMPVSVAMRCPCCCPTGGVVSNTVKIKMGFKYAGFPAYWVLSFSCSILRIKEESHKTNIFTGGLGMTNIQIKNEINYKKSVLVLERLLRFGLITREQAEKIDALNRKSFPPILARLSD